MYVGFGQMTRHSVEGRSPSGSMVSEPTPLHLPLCTPDICLFLHNSNLRPTYSTLESRVAEVGSLSTRAKMATKIFVRRVFAIFAKNASFLCVIQFSIICNMSHCQMLGKVEYGLPAKI